MYVEVSLSTALIIESRNLCNRDRSSRRTSLSTLLKLVSTVIPTIAHLLEENFELFELTNEQKRRDLVLF